MRKPNGLIARTMLVAMIAALALSAGVLASLRSPERRGSRATRRWLTWL